jgi:hypothetical protein
MLFSNLLFITCLYLSCYTTFDGYKLPTVALFFSMPRRFNSSASAATADANPGLCQPLPATLLLTAHFSDVL